jgi:hypothetical protein
VGDERLDKWDDDEVTEQLKTNLFVTGDWVDVSFYLLCARCLQCFLSASPYVLKHTNKFYNLQGEAEENEGDDEDNEDDEDEDEENEEGITVSGLAAKEVQNTDPPFPRYL